MMAEDKPTTEPQQHNDRFSTQPKRQTHPDQVPPNRTEDPNDTVTPIRDEHEKASG